MMQLSFNVCLNVIKVYQKSLGIVFLNIVGTIHFYRRDFIKLHKGKEKLGLDAKIKNALNVSCMICVLISVQKNETSNI